MSETKAKAIVLVSGGLDSSIALIMMLNMGIRVECVFFSMPFCHATASLGGVSYLEALTKKLNVKLHIIDNEETLIEIIKAPRYGFGSNMNPCIDCRIGYFKKAKALMAETGASFLVTGEVLGQRPMSQRLEAMRVIETEAGLAGLVLRPLSAKNLELTIPEKEGWVDREKLYGISGRSRREQMDIAASIGINDYPSPAGGCLLTDPGYSKRLKDLLKHNKDFTSRDAALLKTGRHFRLSEKVKLIVGRNEAENSMLEMLQKEKEILISIKDIPGPNSLLSGEFTAADIKFGASLTARFSDITDRNKKVKTWYKDENEIEQIVEVVPAKEEEYDKLRV